MVEGAQAAVDRRVRAVAEARQLEDQHDRVPHLLNRREIVETTAV